MYCGWALNEPLMGEVAQRKSGGFLITAAFVFCLSGLGRIRTCDQPVMSRPLLPLSYEPVLFI
jgi:hypothetical protein